MVDRSRRIAWRDEQVIEAQTRLGNAKAVAQELRVGHSTILRILAKHGVRSEGLARYRQKARRFNDAEAAVLAERYRAGAWTADLVRDFGGSFYSVKKAILSQGVELRDNPAPLESADEITDILRRYEEGASQQAISFETGRSQSFISRVIRKYGQARPTPTGANHPNWKGGRYVDSAGYVRVLLSPGDPLRSMALKEGHVLEHRVVMARSLGRPLAPRETVHHINGDRSDNRLENLQIRHGSHGKHSAFRCADCGSHNVMAAPLKDTSV